MVIARKVFFLSFIAVAMVSLASCDQARNYLKADRAANLDVQDFRDGLADRVPEVEEWGEVENAAKIPEFQPYIASASDDLKPMPLVSVSVNQSIPLRDIFYELAQQADFDIELDPRITGSIIFSANNKPLDEVVDRIADVSGLRYKITGDVLRVEIDTPYNKVYKVDYLNTTRSSTSSASTNVDVSGDGDGTSTSSGSEFSTESESESDFWGELEANLEQILTGQTSISLRTSSTPTVSTIEPTADVQSVAPTTGDEGLTVQPPEAVLRVDSLPVDEEGAQEAEAIESAFTFNRQAGLVNVFANEKQHEEVDNYLRLLKRSVSSQVLIEAKILEVSLSDQFNAGIDWRLVNVFDNKGVVNFITSGSTVNLNNLAGGGGDDLTLGGNNLTLGTAAGDVQALVNALSQFGTVRALASPRLTVLNNQPAVLNVATNQVFFELDIDVVVGTDGGDTSVTVDSEPRSVPDGVLINVQPSINLDNGTVSMSLRPTITSIADEIQDPGLIFAAAQAGIVLGAQDGLIPELNVQEIDSVINVRSGVPVVMGGLLQDRTNNTINSVPILGEVPVMGALFRNSNDTVSKSEIVILMKATILEQPEDSIHGTDRDIYRLFAGDRRPFKL